MNWVLQRARLKREQHHHRKVKKLQRKQWNRIREIESRYEDLDFFAFPESTDSEGERGVIPDAREKYLLYLLQRVGIHFIPEEALLLARKAGPALATERVCLWLGLDYHKIAAVAPRVASETVRATMYFKEMKRSCEVTGINADALLPHIHFGSHDTREILFESFRTAARVIEIYDGLDDSLQDDIGWKEKRPRFVEEWKDITTDCLMQFYDQGVILSEYRRNIDMSVGVLNQVDREKPLLARRWLSEEQATAWQRKFPVFDIVKVQVHLSNRVREISYRRSREWNRVLKKIVETEFDFRVVTRNGAEAE